MDCKTSRKSKKIQKMGVLLAGLEDTDYSNQDKFKKKLIITEMVYKGAGSGSVEWRDRADYMQRGDGRQVSSGIAKASRATVLRTLRVCKLTKSHQIVRIFDLHDQWEETDAETKVNESPYEPNEVNANTGPRIFNAMTQSVPRGLDDTHNGSLNKARRLFWSRRDTHTVYTKLEHESGHCARKLSSPSKGIRGDIKTNNIPILHKPSRVLNGHQSWRQGLTVINGIQCARVTFLKLFL